MKAAHLPAGSVRRNLLDAQGSKLYNADAVLQYASAYSRTAPVEAPGCVAVSLELLRKNLNHKTNTISVFTYQKAF